MNKARPEQSVVGGKALGLFQAHASSPAIVDSFAHIAQGIAKTSELQAAVGARSALTRQLFDTASVAASFGSAAQFARLAESWKPLAFDRALGQALNSSSLSAVVASFRPQHAALDFLSEVGLLGKHNNMFAAQFAQIMSSQNAITRLAASAAGVTSASALFDTINRYGRVQSFLGTSALAVQPSTLLRGYTRTAGRHYDSYLDGLPSRPIARRAAVARHGGDTQTGLLVVESLTAADLVDDNREELAHHFGAVTAEAWEHGPMEARQDLFDALAELDPGLPDWLKAAWEDIVRDGPKAASKIANCAIECIDQALRILAPVDDVKTWLGQVGPQPGWLHENRPTRRAKVMFAMRHQAKRDAHLAISQVEALAALVQDVATGMQSVKHGDAPTMVVMRSWVFATEGALSQLLLPPQPARSTAN